MSGKSAPEKIEVIKPNDKDIEVIDSNSTGSSFGKEVLATVMVETAKAGIPILFDHINRKSELETKLQETVLTDQSKILNERACKLIELIGKEEEKEDYNQERIDRWKEELNEVLEKQNALNDKAGGFTKTLFNNFKEFLAPKSRM
jgi:hypothetical protein